MLAIGEEAERNLSAREEELRLKERSLSDQSLKYYRQDVTRRIKDPDTYAVLVWGLGFGLQHLYLGRMGQFVVELVIGLLFWGGVISQFASDDPIPIWVLVAAFSYGVYSTLNSLIRAQVIVRTHNAHLSERLFERYSDR